MKQRGAPSAPRRVVAALMFMMAILTPLLLLSVGGLNQQTAMSTLSQQPDTIRNLRSPSTAPTLLWSYTMGGSVGSPHVADLLGNGKYEVIVSSDDVFASVRDHNVYCLNGTTGDKLWSYTTGGGVSSSIVDLFGDGKLEVIALSSDHNVYCLNGTTGAKLWNYTTGGVFYTSPVVADLSGNGRKEVVVQSYDNVLYCLNGTTGNKLWSFTTGDGLISFVLADLFGNGKKQVIVVSSYYIVYCLNGTTGSVVWNYQAPGGNTIGVLPVVADLFGNGKLEVIVGSYDHNVYCLNGTTGNELWRYATGDAICSPLVAVDLFGNDRKEVLAGSIDHNAYCLNGMTGNKLWSLTTGGSGYGFSFAVADLSGNGKKEVLVASPGSDNVVYCLNPTTGGQLWNFTVGDIGLSSFVVADLFGNGKKEVVASSYWSVYCLNGTTGIKVWNSTVDFVQFPPVVADLFGNGKREITHGSSDSVVCFDGTTGNTLWSYPTADGNPPSPVVADLFGNGKREVIVGYPDGRIYCLASPDTTPPATITDLAASNPTNTSITLTWTAPGDDGMMGNATGYVVKYSASGPITASNWDSATTYTPSWTPAKNGTMETHVIKGLSRGTTYWFAIKAYDMVPNYGGVSNSPSATTTGVSTTPPGYFGEYGFAITSNATNLVVAARSTQPSGTGAPPSGLLPYIYFNMTGSIPAGSNVVVIQLCYNRTRAQQLGLNESTLSLYRWNSMTSQWNNIPATRLVINATHGLITAYLSHFSYFAVLGTPATGGGGGAPILVVTIIAIVAVLVLLTTMTYVRKRRTVITVPTKKIKKVKEIQAVEEEEATKVEEAPSVIPKAVRKSPQVVREVGTDALRTVTPSEKTRQLPGGRVSVLRGGEVVGDEYVFKVKVMNDTQYNITNAVVTLAAYPVDCLTGAPGFSELKRVNVIEAGGFASPSFAFRPTRDCVKGTIKAIVNYVDYRNELRTVKVDPHEISMVCGLLKPLVVEEKEFEGSIKDWVKTDGNIEVRGMNAKDVFKKAHDVLKENNFHIIASHEVPIEGMFAAVIKSFARGKYSNKKVGVVLEIRGDIYGEDSFIKVVTSAEEEAMIAPAMQEVLDGLRKPRLFGKKAYYEKLSELVLRIADEMSCDKGGIVSFADLCLAIKREEDQAKIPIDSVEEAVRILCEKGLVGGVRKLSSGIKILEVKPLELSKNLNNILSLVSDTGVTTRPELIKKTGLPKEVVETALERLELAGIAKRVIEQGNVEKWYFPAFYKPSANR